MGIEQLLVLLERNWKLIVAGVAVGVFLSALYLLLATPIYRSQSVVSVLTIEGGMPALSGQFGSLASLAGVQVPGQSEREEAIAFIESRHLAAMFIEKNDLLPRLFSEDWNSEDSSWITGERAPTLGDGIRKLREEMFRVSQDRKSGLLTLTMDWTSREEAAEWLDKFIDLANEQMRERAIHSAELSMKYLDQELASAQVVEVREMLARLQESQLRTLTYARSNPDYSFRVLDPPMVADAHRPLKPRKALTLVAGFIVGCVFAVIAVILAEGWRIARSSRGLRQAL